jgi:hypothetical protein
LERMGPGVTPAIFFEKISPWETATSPKIMIKHHHPYCPTKFIQGDYSSSLPAAFPRVQILPHQG